MRAERNNSLYNSLPSDMTANSAMSDIHYKVQTLMIPGHQVYLHCPGLRPPGLGVLHRVTIMDNHNKDIGGYCSGAANTGLRRVHLSIGIAAVITYLLLQPCTSCHSSHACCDEAP